MTSRRSPRPCYRRATTPRRFTRSVGQGRRRHHRRRLWPQPAARVGAWWCDPRSAAECEPVFARFPLTIRVPEHLGHFLQGGNQRKFMHQAAQTPGASKATAAETRCRFPSAHLGGHHHRRRTALRHRFTRHVWPLRVEPCRSCIRSRPPQTGTCSRKKPSCSLAFTSRPRPTYCSK